MRNLSIFGVVILALTLFALNAAAGRPIIVGAEGPEIASLLGDDGGESDTDGRHLPPAPAYKTVLHISTHEIRTENYAT